MIGSAGGREDGVGSITLLNLHIPNTQNLFNYINKILRKKINAKKFLLLHRKYKSRAKKKPL